MRIRIGKILYFGTFAIGFGWIVLVTFVLWNLDPKFGGPYRWTIFAHQLYWFMALVPPMHLALLAMASRFRWRRMAGGAFAYRYLRSAAAPAGLAILTITTLKITNGVRFGYGFELIELRYPWSNLLYALLPIYAVLLTLAYPMPGRVWIIAGVSLLILFFAGGLLAGLMTENTVTTIENGTLYSRIRPGWAEPFERFLLLANTHLFFFAVTQFVINDVFWLLFLLFGGPRDANLTGP